LELRNLIFDAPKDEDGRPTRPCRFMPGRSRKTVKTKGSFRVAKPSFRMTSRKSLKSLRRRISHFAGLFVFSDLSPFRFAVFVRCLFSMAWLHSSFRRATVKHRLWNRAEPVISCLKSGEVHYNIAFPPLRALNAKARPRLAIASRLFGLPKIIPAGRPLGKKLSVFLTGRPTSTTLGPLTSPGRDDWHWGSSKVSPQSRNPRN
jgi:hypothetical protein